MGEINARGIGAPAIFLRMQGCHLRCYLKTMGILCDTPEGLEKEGGKTFSFDELIGELLQITDRTGIKYICLTGGDPLYCDTNEMKTLLSRLIVQYGYSISVETSGTLSITPYNYLRPEISWVLDYKLQSCGVSTKFRMETLNGFTQNDCIKFVVADEEDWQEFLTVIQDLPASFNIGVGVFWGGKISSAELWTRVISLGLCRYNNIQLNMQAHKLITHADNTDVNVTVIPKEI